MALIARPPQVVVVNPDKVAAKTLAEFIAYAKANPGKLNYGSAGAGTTHHLAGELFKILTKTNIQHVPYRGAGPAMQDLIAGHVPVVFDGLGSSAAPVRAGQLRACGRRAEARAGVPRSSDRRRSGPAPDMKSSTWYGLFAPQEHAAGNRPADDQGIAEGHADSPPSRKRWERNGSDVPDVTGPAFAKMVSAEVERWRKVVSRPRM